MRQPLRSTRDGRVFRACALGSRGQPGRRTPPRATKLPPAIGAIHPRAVPGRHLGRVLVPGRDLDRAPRRRHHDPARTGEGDDTEPAWSPDGKRIAFVRGRAGQTGRGRRRERTSRSEGLQAAGTYGVNKLEFSADGRKLLGAFRVDAQGSRPGLVRPGEWGRAAGRPGSLLYPVRPLAGREVDRPHDAAGPARRADRQQRLVHRRVEDAGRRREIRKGLSGSRPGSTTCAGPRRPVARRRRGTRPGPRRPVEVAARRPAAGDEKLTSGQADEDRPSASRDGKWLAYTDNRDGPTAIVVRDIGDGRGGGGPDRRDGPPPPDRDAAGCARGRGDEEPDVARVSLQGRGAGSMPHPAACTAAPGRRALLLRPGGGVDPPGRQLPAGATAGRSTGSRAREDRDPGRGDAEVTVELERWAHLAKAGLVLGRAAHPRQLRLRPWYNTPATMRHAVRRRGPQRLQLHGRQLGRQRCLRPARTSAAAPTRSPRPTILYWNQEFRSTIWGHMTLVNLQQVVEPVFTGFAGTTNPWDRPSNADVADRAHWREGLVNYTHVSQSMTGRDPLRGQGDPDRRGARQDRHARHQQLVGGVGPALVSAAQLRVPPPGHRRDGCVPEPDRQQAAGRRPGVRPRSAARSPTRPGSRG